MKFGSRAEFVEIAEAFDYGNLGSEQHLVNLGDFREIIDVGYGRRFDSDEFHLLVDTPLGKLFADARESVSVELGVVDVVAPAGVQEQAIARLEGVADFAEVGGGEELIGLNVFDGRDPCGPAKEIQRHLVYGDRMSAEVDGGVAVSARVGVEFPGRRVPAVAFQ